jgi:H+/Cl- antiporter ClcA
MFFMGAALGQLSQHAFTGVHVGVIIAGLMVAANVGVTKTFVGSTLVVSEMGGLRLLPTTLVAAIVALLLTSSVGLIATQRERSPMDAPDDGED